MKNKLTELIGEFREFSSKKRNFEKVFYCALNRDSYENFGIPTKVSVPKEMREEYFNLFKSLIGKNSIDLGVGVSPHFLDSSDCIDFNGYADHNNGCSLQLCYFPNKIALEIADYSFNGEKTKCGIQEIGEISTEKNGLGAWVTNIKVGENFRYRSGYSANHLVSESIDFIQNSKTIPKISENRLENLRKDSEK